MLEGFFSCRDVWMWPLQVTDLDYWGRAMLACSSPGACIKQSVVQQGDI